MAKDPAVLFYTNDFLSGTFTMTDEQVGKYIRLLCLQHQKGKLTEKDMLYICTTYDEDVYSKFVEEDGFFYNKRMYDESIRRQKYSESRKKNVSKRYLKKKKATYVEHMETETETETENRISNNIKKDINNKTKHKYGIYNNVLLTDKEILNLKDKFNSKYEDKINMLSEGLELKGYKYKSHYLAILKWSRADEVSPGLVKYNELLKRLPENKDIFAEYEIADKEKQLWRKK